jgi:hypothetical protein
MQQKMVWIILGFLLFVGQPLTMSEAQEDEIASSVKAYFLGYHNDDIIFRIYNELPSQIKIRGLSFNRQILYRPIEKNAVVPASSEESMYQDIVFRTTGDFIWSENHMDRFQLAYQLLESKERMYTRIFPELPPSELEKELDSPPEP